jgi:glutamine phosphoribosylpyrophosphate amidotransferase
MISERMEFLKIYQGMALMADPIYQYATFTVPLAANPGETTEKDLIDCLYWRPGNFSKHLSVMGAAAFKAFSQVEGAYSLVMMTRHKIIPACDPQGFRPLCLGRIDGGWVIASETRAFDLVGATYIRDVEPGEIIIIDE